MLGRAMLKVRLLNRGRLFSWKCRHHLKISERQGEERRSFVQRITGATGENWKHRGSLVAKKHLQPSDSDMMELYLDLLSQPCRSVYLLAKVAGIPFEFKQVDLLAGNPTQPDRCIWQEERLSEFMKSWFVCVLVRFYALSSHSTTILLLFWTFRKVA